MFRLSEFLNIILFFSRSYVPIKKFDSLLFLIEAFRFNNYYIKETVKIIWTMQ